MLKECYYQDQTELDETGLRYLRRFLDRMVQHRNDCKGSYDGEIRREEIQKINLEKVSEPAKIFLLQSIQRHGAYELLNLQNLDGLMAYDGKMVKECGHGEGKKMKLTQEMFRQNLKRLDEAIQVGIRKGELPEDYVLEIRCIGGFAMSYYNIRESGMTEDMDSLAEINSKVKGYIRDIAREQELPYDWVNDLMLSFGYDASQFHWSRTNMYFGRDSRIRVMVCSKEDLLVNKIRLAELFLTGTHLQDDRDLEPDYQDTIGLLRSYNIVEGGLPAFADVKLKCIGIRLDDYPALKKRLFADTTDEEEDRLVFRMIYRIEKEMGEFSGFTKLIDSLGYSKEDIEKYYGMYIADFPRFAKLFQG